MEINSQLVMDRSYAGRRLTDLSDRSCHLQQSYKERRPQMKQFAGRILTVFSTLTILLTFANCEQRELCYDHSHNSLVSITFDWSLAPEARPSTMVVWFFPVDGGKGTRYELTHNGARSSTDFNTTVKVAPGSYRIVSHNGDTDNEERGHSFYDYEIFTAEDNILGPLNRPDRAPRPDDTDNQPIRSEASTLYACTYDGTVTVEPSAAQATEIVLTPREVTSVWDIRITGVANLSNGIEASAVVTGVAECWNPASGHPGGTEVIVPFPLHACAADCLRGSVVLFGDNAPHDVRHKLRVYTSYMYYYDFDITDQVHAASGNRHVEIRVDGMDLPQTGDGMGTGVTDWEDTENEEIKM